MKLLIDIPEEINKKIKILRISNDFKDREEVVLKILKEKFEYNQTKTNKPNTNQTEPRQTNPNPIK